MTSVVILWFHSLTTTTTKKWRKRTNRMKAKCKVSKLSSKHVAATLPNIEKKLQHCFRLFRLWVVDMFLYLRTGYDVSSIIMAHLSHLSHVTSVTCHLSRVICHVSHGTYHIGTCYVSHLHTHLIAKKSPVPDFTKYWSHEDGMWLPQWLDLKTITYAKISPKNDEP